MPSLIDQITAELVRRGKSQSAARAQAKRIKPRSRRAFLGTVASQGKAGTGLLGLPQGMALPGIAQAQVTVTQSPSGQIKIVAQQGTVGLGKQGKGGTIKKRKTTKKKMGKTTKKYVAAANRITRLIQGGQIAQKQGKIRYSDYSTGTTNEKAKKFVALYKTALAQKGYRSGGALSDIGKKRKVRGPSSTGIQAKYMRAKKKSGLAKRFPYYYAPSRKIAAKVRVVPGTKATPFARLSDSEQRKVVQYLNNTAVGQTMRGKGARKRVPMSVIKSTRPTRTRKTGVAQTQGRFLISDAPAWERIVARQSMKQIRAKLKRAGYQGKLAGKGVNKQKLAKQLAKRS